jgi:DNA-directed RNA polymerase subunit beta
VTDEVVYLSAMEEAKHTSRRPTPRSTKGKFTDDLVSAASGEFCWRRRRRRLMDVSPKQLVSVAAALIPFLENDDANRALMGSNMQRQAVPLIRAEAPFVGTGMEAVVAVTRARDRRPPHRHRRPGRRDPYRHPRHGGDRSVQAGRRHLQR